MFYLYRRLSTWLTTHLEGKPQSGHVLLWVLRGVFGAFVISLGLAGGWAPLLFMVPFTGLEVVVALLQAFVFSVLTCIYLNDAINMHH